MNSKWLFYFKHFIIVNSYKRFFGYNCYEVPTICLLFDHLFFCINVIKSQVIVIGLHQVRFPPEKVHVQQAYLYQLKPIVLFFFMYNLDFG